MKNTTTLVLFAGVAFLAYKIFKLKAKTQEPSQNRFHFDSDRMDTKDSTDLGYQVIVNADQEK